MFYLCIRPTAIARSDWTPERRSFSLINQANDCLAINCRGNRLAELYVLKPRKSARGIWRGLRAGLIQIEKKKIVLETGTGVRHGIAAGLPRKNGIVFRAQPCDGIRIARLESQNLSISTWYKEKNNFVEVRK